MQRFSVIIKKHNKNKTSVALELAQAQSRVCWCPPCWSHFYFSPYTHRKCLVSSVCGAVDHFHFSVLEVLQRGSSCAHNALSHGCNQHCALWEVSMCPRIKRMVVCTVSAFHSLDYFFYVSSICSRTFECLRRSVHLSTLFIGNSSVMRGNCTGSFCLVYGIFVSL